MLFFSLWLFIVVVCYCCLFVVVIVIVPLVFNILTVD